VSATLRRTCAAVSAAAACLGCGAQPAANHPAPPVRAAPSPTVPAGQVTGGWHLTVYYTPVESYHGPPQSSITDCSGAALGRHSAEFLDRVRTEGFGRIVTPLRGFSYLGWDFDRGCWFTAGTPVGADDRPLQPWGSTAAPASIAVGRRLRVVGCGTNVDAAACARVMGAAWTVDDRCIGCGDPRHLDLYVGEEDRPNFEQDSPNYFDAHEAVVALLG